MIAERSLLLAIPYPVTSAGLIVNRNMKDAQGRLRAYGEDSVVVATMRRRHLLRTFHAPLLYTYVVHGNNSCDRQHFDELIVHAKKAHKPWSQIISPAIYAKLEKELKLTSGDCLRNWTCARERSRLEITSL